MKVAVIATIQNVPINLVTDDLGNEIVSFLSDMDIDNDGSGGNPDGDPDHQNDTTLHHNGAALNAYAVPFVVVPPQVCQQTVGKVLGALCLVEHTSNGKRCLAVVGDIGPRDKTGEASPKTASQLGVDPNARHGGESRKLIRYTIFPGVPAVIGGQTYALQSYGRSAAA